MPSPSVACNLACLPSIRIAWRMLVSHHTLLLASSYVCTLDGNEHITFPLLAHPTLAYVPPNDSAACERYNLRAEVLCVVFVELAVSCFPCFSHRVLMLFRLAFLYLLQTILTTQSSLPPFPLHNPLCQATGILKRRMLA